MNTKKKQKTLDKSTTENHAALDGIWESSVYGLGKNMRSINYSIIHSHQILHKPPLSRLSFDSDLFNWEQWSGDR